MYEITIVEEDKMGDIVDDFMDATEGQVTKLEFESLRLELAKLFEVKGWVQNTDYAIGNGFNNAAILWLDLFSKTMLKPSIFDAIHDLSAKMSKAWMIRIATDDGMIAEGYRRDGYSLTPMPIGDFLGDLLVCEKQIYLSDDSKAEFLAILPTNMKK